MLHFDGLGKGETESGPLGRLRIDPDAAAVPFHDLLAEGQADAGAGVLFPTVQALEDDENSLRILGVDANAVVAHGEGPGRAVGLGADQAFPAGARLPERVDAVMETVGEATWGHSLRALRPGGTIVTCGATTGPRVELDLRFLFSRQLSLLGSYMGTMSELHEVLGHVFAGRLKPVIDRSFPLQETRAAHEYMEKSQMFGKIVLNV